MIGAVLLGVGFGAGLWALSAAVFPARPTLRERLDHAMSASAAALPQAPRGGWATVLGRPFVGMLRASGLPGAQLSRDLAIIATPVADHLALKVTLTIVGLLTPPLAQLMLGLLGGPVAAGVPAAAGLTLAAVGFVLPDLRVRRDAGALRATFRHGLSGYLDLVWITLAGGSGVDSALNDSVRFGRGWAFTQIRRALDAARLTRTTPWASLRRLGEDLDVTELAELAASVSLAGTEGAKVRASLAAKAAALRVHQISDAEAAAQAATERMSLPVTLLFLGYLIFIGYPALTQVLNGL